MIKVDKNLALVPISLKPPTEAFFPPPNVAPTESKTTHSRRLRVISDKRYTNDETFNSRYKYQDIKDALKLIYHNKCAFCEQKIELSHVEHYRPKDIYHWLAFSWDNLILACHHCNIYKSVHFEISARRRVTFTNNIANIQRINTLSAGYDTREQPKMINPEITDPSDFITFLQSGEIESNDPRFIYTITTCKISRSYLNDERRKLINDFRADVIASLALYTDRNQQLEAIKVLVLKFKNDAEKKENQFLAFRRFAITNNWLNNIIKDSLQLI